MATVVSTQVAAAPAVRWHVMTAGFVSYGFDAMDFMMLALALPATSSSVCSPIASDGAWR